MYCNPCTSTCGIMGITVGSCSAFYCFYVKLDQMLLLWLPCQACCVCWVVSHTVRAWWFTPAEPGDGW
jgi:hypothetical protein